MPNLGHVREALTSLYALSPLDSLHQLSRYAPEREYLLLIDENNLHLYAEVGQLPTSVRRFILSLIGNGFSNWTDQLRDAESKTRQRILMTRRIFEPPGQ